MNDYIEQANVTAAGTYHGYLVPIEHFKAVLEETIAALNKLDRIKKTMFYGRDLGLTNIDYDSTCFINCKEFPCTINESDYKRNLTEDKSTLIMHGIIGSATESGELLEALNALLFGHERIDAVNLVEELGDQQWYQAIIAGALGVDFDLIQRTNIDKLRKRFGDKFTAYEANNRNLQDEREVLETGVDK